MNVRRCTTSHAPASRRCRCETCHRITAAARPRYRYEVISTPMSGRGLGCTTRYVGSSLGVGPCAWPCLSRHRTRPVVAEQRCRDIASTAADIVIRSPHTRHDRLDDLCGRGRRGDVLRGSDSKTKAPRASLIRAWFIAEEILVQGRQNSDAWVGWFGSDGSLRRAA